MSDNTPLLLKTIRIEQGTIFNLFHHPVRMKGSREDRFHRYSTITFAFLLNTPDKQKTIK